MDLTSYSYLLRSGVNSPKITERSILSRVLRHLKFAQWACIV
jgi:hypothetical protein